MLFNVFDSRVTHWTLKATHFSVILGHFLFHKLFLLSCLVVLCCGILVLNKFVDLFFKQHKQKFDEFVAQPVAIDRLESLHVDVLADFFPVFVESLFNSGVRYGIFAIVDLRS